MLGAHRLAGIAQQAPLIALPGTIVLANSSCAISSAAVAAIVDADVIASNGIVHIVDALLIPPDIGGID